MHPHSYSYILFLTEQCVLKSCMASVCMHDTSFMTLTVVVCCKCVMMVQFAGPSPSLTHRFKSLHCHLHPEVDWCAKNRHWRWLLQYHMSNLTVIIFSALASLSDSPELIYNHAVMHRFSLYYYELLCACNIVFKSALPSHLVSPYLISEPDP